MTGLLVSLFLLLTITNSGPYVTLTWDEFIVSKHTYIYRGLDLIGVADPGEVIFTYYEPHYGVADYTVGQYIWGVGFVCETETHAMGRLTWRPPSQPVLGYTLYFTHDLGYQGKKVIGDVTSYPLVSIGLIPGGYSAYITAYNAAGESLPSNTIYFSWFRRRLP